MMIKYNPSTGIWADDEHSVVIIGSTNRYKIILYKGEFEYAVFLSKEYSKVSPEWEVILKKVIDYFYTVRGERQDFFQLINYSKNSSYDFIKDFLNEKLYHIKCEEVDCLEIIRQMALNK